MGPSLFAAWAVEVGIITVRDFQTHHRPPLPSELLATFVVFGSLSLVAGPAPKAAGGIGWGLVVATLLSSRVDVLKPIGDFMQGGPSAAGQSAAGGVIGAAAGGAFGSNQ